MGAVSRLSLALAALLLVGTAQADEMSPRVTAMRALLDSSARKRVAVPTRLASVEDRTVAFDGQTLRLRLYRNDDAAPRPALLMLHGGGWIAGSVDTHDEIARILARDLHATVVSLDYSLSPEQRYPRARDEAFAALRWMVQQAASLGIDASRVAVLGDSSGGNLAAAVTLLARDRNGPAIRAQALINPVLDLVALDTPSYLRIGSDAMQFYRAQYLAPGTDAHDPYVSPLRADLHRLPPTLVAIAGNDSLLDEDEAFVARLRDAGVETERVFAPDQTHFGMRWATGDASLRETIDCTLRFFRHHLQ